MNLTWVWAKTNNSAREFFTMATGVDSYSKDAVIQTLPEPRAEDCLHLHQDPFPCPCPSTFRLMASV